MDFIYSEESIQEALKDFNQSFQAWEKETNLNVKTEKEKFFLDNEKHLISLIQDSLFNQDFCLDNMNKVLMTETIKTFLDLENATQIKKEKFLNFLIEYSFSSKGLCLENVNKILINKLIKNFLNDEDFNHSKNPLNVDSGTDSLANSIIAALNKFEDKLVGFHFTSVSHRQYLQRFLNVHSKFFINLIFLNLTNENLDLKEGDLRQFYKKISKKITVHYLKSESIGESLSNQISLSRFLQKWGE